MEPVEIKSLPFEAQVDVKSLSRGIVEGVFAVFGNVDGAEKKALGVRGDKLYPGSFDKTLQENGIGLPFEFDHEVDEHGDPFPSGVTLEYKALGRDELPPMVLARAPDATGGIWARAQLAMTPGTRRRLREVKSRGGLLPLSFMYRPTRFEVRDGVRHIYELACYAWSGTLRNPPANMAAIGEVKSDGEQTARPNPVPFDSAPATGSTGTGPSAAGHAATAVAEPPAPGHSAPSSQEGSPEPGAAPAEGLPAEGHSAPNDLRSRLADLEGGLAHLRGKIEGVTT